MNALQAARAESTRMYLEAASAARAVRAQLEHDAASIKHVAAEIRRLQPRTVITCARGSSDHAATYAKYLIETHTGVVTASAAPSVNSVYEIRQDLRGCLFIALSQSGRSPDLLASVAAAKSSGATILTLCNSPDAPLVAASDLVIDLRAGIETSVAATKSYLATLAALARLVAAWTLDTPLQSALEVLPTLMERNWAQDWSHALGILEPAQHLYVVGRGFGLAAAQEIALKCKETSGLHAEAFSSAELRHGPFTLLQNNFPALLLAQDDATRPGVEALAHELVSRGVPVMLAGGECTDAVVLPTGPARPELAPILLVQSAYRLIASLSVNRGFDPDNPAHLRKITETL